MDVKVFLEALSDETQDALYEHYRHHLYVELVDAFAGETDPADIEWGESFLREFRDITGEPEA